MTASVVLLTGNGNTNFSTASAVTYFPLCGGVSIIAAAATEARAQFQASAAGTLSRMFANVRTNTRTTDTDILLHIGGVDSGTPSTVSALYGSGVSGVISDTTDSAAVSANDLLNYKFTTGINTGNFDIALIGINFLAASGTTNFLLNYNVNGGVSFSGTGPISDYVVLAGSALSPTTTESAAQALSPIACTAKYLQANVVSNARSTTTTISFRDGASSDSNNLSYTSGQSGQKTNTTIAHAVSANDLLNYLVSLGTGTGSFVIANIGVAFDATSDGNSFVCNGNPGGLSFAASASSYFIALGGDFIANTNENTAAGAVGLVNPTFSNLWVFLPTNASSATVNLRLRVNGANANQNVVITAGVSGAYQDTTHSDTPDMTKTIGYGLSGVTTSAVTISAITMQVRAPFTASQAAQASSSSVASLKRSTGKPLNASSSAVASLVRQAGKLLQASSASVASWSRQLAISKSFQASSVVVASLVRQTGKAFQATSVAIASRTNQVGKALQASSSALASASRQTGKALQASSSASVSATKAIALSRQAASSSVGDMSFQLGKGLAAESFSVASLSLQTGKFLQASSSAVASLVRSIGKLLQATSAAIASATAVKHSSGITAQASSESVASLTKSFPRALQASSSPVATLVRQIGKLLQASSAAVASLSRSTALFFQASSPSVATAAKTIPQSMQAASSAIATLTLRFGKGVVNRARLLGTRFQAGLEATKTVAQLIGQRVQASLSGTRSDPNLEGTKTQPTLDGEVDE